MIRAGPPIILRFLGHFLCSEILVQPLVKPSTSYALMPNFLRGACKL
jgi:hypothetical protein